MFELIYTLPFVVQFLIIFMYRSKFVIGEIAHMNWISSYGLIDLSICRYSPFRPKTLIDEVRRTKTISI